MNDSPLITIKSRFATVREAHLQQLRLLIGLLTEEDMILLLGVSEHTLQYWRQHANGPRYAKLGKNIFYRVDDVMAWVEANIREGTNVEVYEDAGS